MYCGEPAEEHRKLARSSAQQAVLLDPDNADAHMILGYLRAYEGELVEGLAECEKGLRINPNHAEGWVMLADLRVLEGRAVEAIECARSAFRLNPYRREITIGCLGLLNMQRATIKTPWTRCGTSAGAQARDVSWLPPWRNSEECQKPKKRHENFCWNFRISRFTAMGKHTTIPQRWRPAAFHRRLPQSWSARVRVRLMLMVIVRRHH